MKCSENLYESMFQVEIILQRIKSSSKTIDVFFDPYVSSRTIEWIALRDRQCSFYLKKKLHVF